MSFDPYGYGPESQLPPPGGPPGSAEPFGSGGRPPGSGSSQDPEAVRQCARERVTLPAIFLIVIGALNILPAGYMIVNGLFINSLSTEQFQQVLAAQPAFQKQQMEDLAKQGYSASSIKQIAGNIYLGCGGGGILFAFVIVLGGIRMLQLKNYGLVMFSSLLTMIPCLSGSACCGIGELVGLWAIIVLLSAEVRMAFR